MKARRAECEEQSAGKHARFREQRGAQPDRQRCAGDIDQFIRCRLEGESGIQLRAVTEDLRPAGAHHRRYAGHGSGKQRRGEQRPYRPVLVGRRDQHCEGEHGDHRGRHDDARLTEAIHQPRYLRRNKRVHQRETRRNGAGQPVFAMRLRQHGDDPDRRHGDRQPGNEAGRRETLGAGGSKYFRIGILHALAPRQGTDRQLHTLRMKSDRSYAAYVNWHTMRM